MPPAKLQYGPPIGDEETSTHNHLIEYGACSPTNAEATQAAIAITIDVPFDQVMMDGTGALEMIARRICNICPLQQYCLEYALANPSIATDGVWGARNTKERRRERRNRARRNKTRLQRRESD